MQNEVFEWIAKSISAWLENRGRSRALRRHACAKRYWSRPCLEALESRRLLTIGPETTSWLEGSQGEFAHIVNGANLGAGPVTTWTGNTTPVLGDVQKISYSSSWVYLQQDPDLASYVMGPWFNANGSVFPNLPTNQNMTFRIPRAPVQASTHAATGLGEIGMFVNGVAMFNSLDGFSYSAASGTDKSSMGPPGQTGDGIWQRNANYAEEATFDHGHGHQPGNGEYHYHENPTALRAQLGDNLEYTGAGTTDYFPYDTVTTGSDTHANDEDENYEELTSGFHHSPILGWARDGYPVYGPYGYTDPNDATSVVVRMVPNYQLRSITQRHSLDDWAARLHSFTPDAQGQFTLPSNRWGPDVSAQNPLGKYIEDFETVTGLGHLDIYNGRTTKTPEYPNGTYAYFLTIDSAGEGMFPYAVGPQYSGNATGGRVNSITETATTCFDIAVGNTSPTISDISNQTVSPNTSVGPLSFTIGDGQTATTELLVSATSSNTSLVVSSGITLGGSGANRTLTINPVANASGTTTISVRVQDCAGVVATDTFTLTVSANNAPTITNIIDQMINEDGSTGPLNFTVDDVETLAASLIVSGSSSNTTLVPSANIVFGGSGADWTVTVTPAANQNGSATITVTVTDANGGTATDTFLLTVNSVNDEPTITNITDQTVDEDHSTGTLSFTIGDAETPAASLTVNGSSSKTTLVPDANIVFGGSGTSRSVTVTPISGQHGSTTITVTVADGDGGVTIGTFVLTVNSVNDVPTLAQPIPDQQATEDSAFAFTLAANTFADVDSGDTLTITATLADGSLLPNWLAFSAPTGKFAGTPFSADVGSLDLRVTATDSGNESVGDTFSITVANSNDSPTDILLSANSVAENAAGGVIGTVSVTDPDAGDTHMLRVSDNRFEIVAGQLKLKAGESLDFEAGASFSLEITARDAGGLELTQLFAIDVTDRNDPPTAISLSATSIRENITGAIVGTLSATDQDAGQTHTFVVEDPRWEIAGGMLKLKGNQFLNLSEGTTVSVDVSTTDNGNPPRSFTQTLVLNVTANSHPWQNPLQTLDTDDDLAHTVAPIDALLIINLLNDPGKLLDAFGHLPQTRPAESNLAYFDTDGDGSVAPIDVLLVVNFLNAASGSEGEFTLGMFNPTSPTVTVVQTERPRRRIVMESPKLIASVADIPALCRTKLRPIVRRTGDDARLSSDLEDVLAELAADVSRPTARLGMVECLMD